MLREGGRIINAAWMHLIQPSQSSSSDTTKTFK